MAETLKLHFKKPGLLTTVQDGGRNGYQHLGIPVNGFMDRSSAQEANRLVDNDLNGPVLEITMLGPEITFEGEGQIAITGGDLSPTMYGQDLEMYTTIDIQDGDVIKFGRPLKGCRAYLAVRGAWQFKPWLGSLSATAVQPDVLTPDSIIKKDSVIEVLSDLPTKAKTAREGMIFDSPGLIEVLPGPEFSQLSNYSVASFFSQTFTVSNDSNRMGYRLNGKVAGFEPLKEIISSGIIPGTIQLTNAGQPIVLMADAQTSGGYFRLGNLTQNSIDQLAQMKPGELLRFVLADMSTPRSDRRSDSVS